MMIQAEGIVYPAGGGVLSGVTLRAGEGEIVGVLGGNGSGKTLLIEILATLRRPYAGLLTIMGEDAIQRPYQARQQIGYVPEGVHLLEEFSVEDYLALFARCYGLRGEMNRRRREEVTGMLELEGVSRAPLKDLSYGLLRRLSIARALIHQPKILLVETPFMGLDDEGRRLLSGLLMKLRSEGVAMICTLTSSSDPEGDCQRLCDRIEILKQGELRPCPL